MTIMSFCSCLEHPLDASHNICSIVFFCVEFISCCNYYVMFWWLLSHVTKNAGPLHQPVEIGAKNNRFYVYPKVSLLCWHVLWLQASWHFGTITIVGFTDITTGQSSLQKIILHSLLLFHHNSSLISIRLSVYVFFFSCSTLLRFK